MKALIANLNNTDENGAYVYIDVTSQVCDAMGIETLTGNESGDVEMALDIAYNIFGHGNVDATVQ